MGFGAAVALIVAASGHLSGAHVNPAVTIGFWSLRRFPARDVVPYIAAQCIGAVIASYTLAWALGTVGGFGETVPSISVARAFVVEAGYSGLLAFVIMGVATEPKTPPAVAPFAIGVTVFAGALVTGPVTGDPSLFFATGTTIVWFAGVGVTSPCHPLTNEMSPSALVCGSVTARMSRWSAAAFSSGPGVLTIRRPVSRHGTSIHPRLASFRRCSAEIFRRGWPCRVFEREG